MLVLCGRTICKLDIYQFFSELLKAKICMGLDL